MPLTDDEVIANFLQHHACESFFYGTKTDGTSLFTRDAAGRWREVARWHDDKL
jgi:hypothetical protein